MQWKIDNDIRRVDVALASVFKYLNLIRHVNPINVAEEREAFLSGAKRNPFFEYKSPRGDITQIRKKLLELSIPDTAFGLVLEHVRQEFLKRCEIIHSIGRDEARVRELTAAIYGWPTEHVITYARRILSETSDAPDTLFVPSEVLAGEMKRMFRSLGLDGWEIKYSKKYLTRTRHTRKLCIAKDRLFSELDLYRLPIHEVGVHAVRYENAHAQPLSLFSYGFSGFLETEEGMATYFEEQTGHSSSKVFRNYAGRVMAVSCLKEGLDFRDCFERLQSFGFDESDSWNLTLRAYRGGGFVKDHLYLQGYLRVKQFAQDVGDFKTLYVGKVGIDDYDLIKELLDSHVIHEPKIIPPFVESYAASSVGLI